MTIHQIESDKRHLKGVNEDGNRWLFFNDFDLIFVETNFWVNGSPTVRIIQAKRPNSGESFPVFDNLVFDQVKELIQNNLP